MRTMQTFQAIADKNKDLYIICASITIPSQKIRYQNNNNNIIRILKYKPLQ
jgi:hypothetical protein